MLNVVIVEDEDIIRTGLQYTVDWLSMDAVIVAACENGQEGITKIKELQPDIVITDIKMPIMDGLTMIEQAYKCGCSFLPIIVTSYSEFEYAKKSISLDVFDYLLKPISNQKIKEVMLRAKERIEKEHKVELFNEFSEMSKSSNNKTTLSIMLTTVSENPYLHACLTVIEQNYTSNPNIEQIAQNLHISVSYLSRIFKKHTSMTFLNFLNRYRIQKATELLATQQYKVYEVAEMTGFSNYKHFHKVFKECTGMSPKTLVHF